jgi:hypothetical protein
MSATEIFSRLREKIEVSDRNLHWLSVKTKVPYHRLYRFWTQGAELSIDDANCLFEYLTGKSFISLPDENAL